MGRPETLAAVREKFPVYKDMPNDQLAEALAAKYPQYQDLVTKKAEVPRGEGDKATGPTTPESIQRGIFGAGQPEPLNMLQRVGNAVLPPLVAAPAETALTGGGGMIASKLAPRVPGLAAAGGRALTSGLIGAGKAASQGKDALQAGLWDTGVAAAFEGILSGIPYLRIPFTGTRGFKGAAEGVAGRRAEFAEKTAEAARQHRQQEAMATHSFEARTAKAAETGARRAAKAGEEFAGRQKAFQAATDAPKQAYEALKDHVPSHAWMNVPAISKKPITFKEATEKLADLKGADYEAAHQQILQALETGPRLGAGAASHAAAEFKTRTAGSRFDPAPLETPPSPFVAPRRPVAPQRQAPPVQETGAERKAEAIMGALESPATRAAVDVGATQDVGGVPAGLWPPIMLAPESLGKIAERVIRH